MDKLKPVIEWIKGHVMIALMCVLIVAFIACGWYFSGALNEELASDISTRKQLFQKIDKAGKSSVSLPLTGGDAFSANGVLNPKLLDSLRVLSDAMKKDLDEAREIALTHNGDPWPDKFPHPEYTQRKLGHPGTGKRLLVDEKLFPNPPANEREDLQNKVHRALVNAYASMLEVAGAGSPPPAQDIQKHLASARSNFIQADLHKGTEADLDQQERTRLQETLTKTRLQYYNEAASKIRFYASTNAFQLPADPFTTKAQHSLGELYGWHWDWWIAEDVISALVRANVGDDPDEFIPVQHAPVKRLVALRAIGDVPGVGKSSGNNSGGTGGQGRRAPRGGRGGGMSGANAGQPSAGAWAPLGEPQISMDVSVNNDFGTSMTGRQSNALYDVRNVELEIVVETARLPKVINALAMENFITITDLTLRPTSAFDAAEYGYMFGDRPVSLVRMQLETIWFRKWTSAWMPQDVRDALGVQSQAPGTQG